MRQLFINHKVTKAFLFVGAALASIIAAKAAPTNTENA